MPITLTPYQEKFIEQLEDMNRNMQELARTSSAEVDEATKKS
jgi:hypothetical protein